MKIGRGGQADAGEAAATARVRASERSTSKPPAGTSQDAARRFGLGPAAAKVYGLKKGLSIGGYGEVLYSNFACEEPERRAVRRRGPASPSLRAVVYLGYKFDQHFVLNTEIEYENAVVASDKGGEAEVEFAYIDYMNSPAFNARAGLVLIPSGLVNQLHEPTAFLGARRPDVEDVIIPTTWRELGVGVYGEVGTVLVPAATCVNGLNAAGYSADEGIREGRQEGSEALAKNWAFTGRVDFTSAAGPDSSARSVFSGDSGQGQFTPSGQKISGVDDARRSPRRLAVARPVAARPLRPHDDRPGRPHQPAQQLRGRRVDRKPAGGLVRPGRRSTSSRSCGIDEDGALIPFVRYERWDTQPACPAGYESNPENNVARS